MAHAVYRRVEPSAVPACERVAAALRAFYLSPLSMSSTQPLLDLAVEYNPDLRDRSPFPCAYPLELDPAPDCHLGATEAV